MRSAHYYGVDIHQLRGKESILLSYINASNDKVALASAIEPIVLDVLPWFNTHIGEFERQQQRLKNEGVVWPYFYNYDNPDNML